ncbi:MAG: hypothetical protein HZB38_04930 [Planctomycetes bacterium]|nr:hypothetical protein [Planctomycetota bacterium]
MTQLVEQLYRPGLEGIIAGETNISAVKQDSLMYRGYAIEELAEHSCFEEVGWLLLNGELPNAAQLSAFKATLDKYRALPREVIETIRLMPKGAPGMDVCRTAMSMAGHFCPIKGDDKASLNEKAARIFAIVPTIIGARMHFLAGKTPVEPRPGMSHAAQTLWLAFGKEPKALDARVLDLTLILYAEHEFNASTFANRVTASTLSDIYSGMVTGIGTLKGPLHGGANEETEQRKIYMNVDYPCGPTYYFMGLPIDIYTPLFVASRVTGWSAHFIEQYTNNRIIRPLSRYVGPQERKYVPIEKR